MGGLGARLLLLCRYRGLERVQVRSNGRRVLERIGPLCVEGTRLDLDSSTADTSTEQVLGHLRQFDLDVRCRCVLQIESP